MKGDQGPGASTAHMVDYDAHSHMQAGLVRARAEELCRLVEAVGVVSPEFVVMDHGCGPGRNAVQAVRPVVSACRRVDPDGAVTVRHMDQPGNDWNGLLEAAFGPAGYHRDHPRVRTEAVAGSFYDEVAAPGSVALATCFTASHWLSGPYPVHSPGTVWFADLEGEPREAFAARARADWTTFLRRRARELRPDGRLMVATLGAIADNTERNGVRVSARRLYRAIFTVAKGMVTDGLLSASALDRFVFPLWFPTADDLMAPIAAAPDLAGAFEIVSAEVTPAAFNPDDVYRPMIHQPETYAALYAGYVRGFGESTLRLHLFKPSARREAEVDGLTETFFHRLAALYRDEPGKHASETMIATLVLRRR